MKSRFKFIIFNSFLSAYFFAFTSIKYTTINAVVDPYSKEIFKMNFKKFVNNKWATIN